MHTSSYLTLSRHNIYYFRYPLIRVQNKIKYINISLGTREPKEALLLARGLGYYASEISRCYEDFLMHDHEAKQIVSDYLKAKLEEHKKRIDQQPYYTDTLSKWSRTIKDINKNPQPYTEEVIQELGLDIKNEDADFLTLHRYVKRNLPDYYKELKAYNTQAFKVGLRTHAPAVKEAMPTYKLSDVIAKFMAASETERSWRDSRRAEVISFLAALSEILGSDYNTMAMDKEKAGHIVDIIYQLPINKEKNPQTRGLGIIEAIQVQGIKKISSGTITKYLGAYSMFFEWCENRGYASSNPFKNLKANVGKGTRELRYAFSDSEVQLILSELSSYPEGAAKREYEYWGSMIALYTGARLGEITQLELSDIQQVDNIWYFDINDNADNKKLKSLSSKRKIPIHDKLINSGLIQYVEKLKLEGKERLLHELNLSRGSYGKNLGRFFNTRLLPALGIKEKNVSFHCLRHTVNTRLLQCDVEPFKIQSILGHTVKVGMTANYAQEGYKLSQLQEAIHKLPY